MLMLKKELADAKIQLDQVKKQNSLLNQNKVGGRAEQSGAVITEGHAAVPEQCGQSAVVSVTPPTPANRQPASLLLPPPAVSIFAKAVAATAAKSFVGPPVMAVSENPAMAAAMAMEPAALVASLAVVETKLSTQLPTPAGITEAEGPAAQEQAPGTMMQQQQQIAPVQPLESGGSLPPGWSKHWSKRCRKEYWFNTKSGRQSWDPPTGGVPGSASSDAKPSPASASAPPDSDASAGEPLPQPQFSKTPAQIAAADANTSCGPVDEAPAAMALTSSGGQAGSTGGFEVARHCILEHQEPVAAEPAAASAFSGVSNTIAASAGEPLPQPQFSKTPAQIAAADANTSCGPVDEAPAAMALTSSGGQAGSTGGFEVARHCILEHQEPVAAEPAAASAFSGVSNTIAGEQKIRASDRLIPVVLPHKPTRSQRRMMHKQVARQAAVMIVVKHLQWWTSDADLEQRFASYGKIRNIRFQEDVLNGRSKGTAQICFAEA